MRLLLDTHMLVWFSGGERLLWPAEKAAIDRAEGIAVSAISVWELRIKWRSRHASGERKGPADPQQVLAWLMGYGLPLIDLTGSVAAAPLHPPFAHTDPFDELLLTHAQQTGRRLLTRDKKMKDHPVALLAQ